LDFNYLDIEVVSVLLSLVFVVAIVFKKIWAWPFGILGSIFSTILFYQSYLFSESLLNLYYVAAGFYGWYFWNKNKVTSTNFTCIEISIYKHLNYVLISLFLSTLLGLYFHNYTQASLPFLDSFTTIFSFLATYLQARKVLSSWFYWMILNFVSSGMYWYKDLNIYAVYSLFLFILSICGLISWRKSALKVD
jgi:nicotinamide mononucleotide transporter